MAVLIVLFGAWLVFRGIGALGVAWFGTWHESARFALVVMFVFTGIAHFTKTKHDMARMVPATFPRPMLMVYFTGICELAGAGGLIFSSTRLAAAVCLIFMLIGLFAANVKAAREGLMIAGKRATPLWLRAPMQALFIGLLWWAR